MLENHLFGNASFQQDVLVMVCRCRPCSLLIDWLMIIIMYSFLRSRVVTWLIIIVIVILFIMVKTQRSTSQQPVTQEWTATIYLCLHCHSGQQPMTQLSCRTATTTRFSPKAARNRRFQGLPTSDQVGFYLAHTHQMAPQSTHPIKQACYSFIDLERMKGWVSLVGWPVADLLTT